MQFRFGHRTIVVTGATRGIGKQIADDLLQLGATLILTGTHPEEVQRLNDEAAAKGERKQYFCVDFGNTGSLDAFLDQLKGMDRIDGLVNNAGINRLNAIDEVRTGDWDDMLAVNLSAPFRLIRELSAKMKQNRFGRIVNIASIFSKVSKERRSVYSATKFGLHGLTVGVSNDLAAFNIMVNTLSPGFILTDLTRQNLSEQERDELASVVPAKRLGVTKDISAVAVFLLSDLNQYLTGQNIVVDGGFTNV
jgi:NAD(P)-dependent dehydrogenase (short-subunit alcohol dehydrogenase family)